MGNGGMKIEISTANTDNNEHTLMSIEAWTYDASNATITTPTRPSQFPPVLTLSSSTSGSPTPSSPPTPSKLVYLPFSEWGNTTMLSISTLDAILAACPLDIPTPVSFALYHSLQPRYFHNDLTTHLFDNIECSDDVYFAGLAPHPCQNSRRHCLTGFLAFHLRAITAHSQAASSFNSEGIDTTDDTVRDLVPGAYAPHARHNEGLFF